MNISQALRAARFLPWMLACAAALCGEVTTLTILHLNDLHGWMLPSPDGPSTIDSGGMERLAAEVKKNRTPTSLFVASGDLIQGSNLSNLNQGRPVIEALNLMGLEASAVGNHEFDFGLDVLRQRMSEAAFPFLAANITGSDIWIPFVVRQVGGVRVGLFGLTTTGTPVYTHPRNVAGLDFLPPVEVARKMVGILRPQADVIVLLSHLGIDEERGLMAEVPGIDVIVGGHSHTKLELPVEAGGTLLVQAYEKGRCLGRLDLRVEDGRITGHDYHLISITPESGSDGVVAALVDGYRRDLEQKLSQAVGVAEVDMVGDVGRVRCAETNLGDLIADIMREVSGADIAIFNGGGIRAGIPAGPVTLGAIYNVLPFDNYILSLPLSGREVREALENGVSRVEVNDGGFPQVSGLSFIYDRKAPAGHRVGEILVGGEPLADDRLYVVATADFLAAGGNNYTVFAGKTPVYNFVGRYMRDVVADYWRQAGTVGRSVDGRIREK